MFGAYWYATGLTFAQAAVAVGDIRAVLLQCSVWSCHERAENVGSGGVFICDVLSPRSGHLHEGTGAVGHGLVLYMRGLEQWGMG